MDTLTPLNSKIESIIELFSSGHIREALNTVQTLISQHPNEALPRYILQKMKQSKQHPNASRIFAAEILHGAPYLREQLQTDLKAQFIKTCQVFHDWIAKKWMDPISPEHLLFLIWSSTQAYSDYALQSSLLMDKEELGDNDFETGLELISRLVLKGCGINLV